MPRELILGPTSHYFYSQRLKLHYVDWGNADKPPLLLIHGGRDHARNWDWVATELRHDYHIIAPDLRGHGDSQWAVGGSYAMIDYVLDVVQLLNALQLFPITIIGHSLGGSIALQYCGVYPDRVRKVVAIEGLGPPPSMLRDTPAHQRMSVWIGEMQATLAKRHPHRYTSLDDAVARMRDANPQLTPGAGASPDDPRLVPRRRWDLPVEVRQLRTRRVAVSVQHERGARHLGTDHLSGAARARHRVVGLRPVEGRARHGVPQLPQWSTSRRPATGCTTTSSTSF